ncbi:MAG: GtrA family protein [Deltaproteobacteria bacterium]
MYKLFKQGISFVIISGMGWIIDFSCYLIIINFFFLNIFQANMLSAIPAVTFVFFTSTRRTFVQKKSRLKLGHKYIIYFVYQVLLVLFVSWIGQLMYYWFMQSELVRYTLILNYIKIIIKLIITCFTVIINFITMKLLIEKL